MKLQNRTRHNTEGLRVMFYNLAKQARISTSGVTVKVLNGRAKLHGLCYPHSKVIKLWLLPKSKTQDISFIFLHELGHLTKKNRQLYAKEHGRKAQVHADSIAEKVTGINHKDVQWRKTPWHTLRNPAGHDKEQFKDTKKYYEYKFPQLEWRIIKVKHDKEWPYRLQYKKVKK